MTLSFPTPTENQDAIAFGWNFAHILRLLEAKGETAMIRYEDRSRAERIAAREASDALDAARAIEREAFAASRGWRIAIRPLRLRSFARDITS
jgi:hypothetical protein